MSKTVVCLTRGRHRGRLHGIPAADIGKVNLRRLARSDPNGAAEIAQLGERLNAPDCTDEELFRLVELLAGAGYPEDGEILLRSSVDESEEAKAVNERLVGTKFEERYGRAIRDFAREFSLVLTYRDDEYGYLDEVWMSVPQPETGDRYNILDGECQVRFHLDANGDVTAEVVLASALAVEDSDQIPVVNAFDMNTCMFLRWRGDAWMLTDWREVGGWNFPRRGWPKWPKVIRVRSRDRHQR